MRGRRRSSGLRRESFCKGGFVWEVDLRVCLHPFRYWHGFRSGEFRLRIPSVRLPGPSSDAFQQ